MSNTPRLVCIVAPSILLLLCLHACAAAKTDSLENATLSVTVNPDATISVTDKRTRHIWRQKLVTGGRITGSSAASGAIDAVWHCNWTGLDFKLNLSLEADLPEFTIELATDGDFKANLQFPHPFLTEPGTYLVVPMNEGISYPVDDKTINERWLVAYGGHGICMPFWGVTDGQAAQMAIIETPDDAAVNIKRIDARLCIVPVWNPQKERFGYKRRLRYIFFDKGGHVAICKRYRAYAQKTGLLKTLAQKRQQNPHVDLLIGAVNVWCWERNALDIVREMKAAGIDRILWSNRKGPDVIKAMNRIPGILTSRYDIYQDLMDPKVVKEQLRGLHPDWTQDAWPADLMLDEKGDWRKGWRVKGKDGKMYPCGVLCDMQARKYARRRVPEELKTHPYRCRFIDTTTASPWRECYDPNHPMTRTDSRRWKMELLRYMSEEMKLVTGSETGHDAAVPFVHYFEGMLSLGPYRVPDAGRNMRKIWNDVPERVAKFQLGQKYRLPLWELVYHDCVVAQWYWGDYNNKLPSLWKKRDLFNILYATPPMFMFDYKLWQRQKDRFAQSYKRICPLVRSVGYAEMTDHKFLTPDRNVQQTTFANRITITVNFAMTPYTLAPGLQIAPMDYRVSGMPDTPEKPSLSVPPQPLCPLMPRRQALAAGTDNALVNTEPPLYRTLPSAGLPPATGQIPRRKLNRPTQKPENRPPPPNKVRLFQQKYGGPVLYMPIHQHRKSGLNSFDIWAGTFYIRARPVCCRRVYCNLNWRVKGWNKKYC